MHRVHRRISREPILLELRGTPSLQGLAGRNAKHLGAVLPCPKMLAAAERNCLRAEMSIDYLLNPI
ncbi:MAG TPA: hypothetical protein DDW52_03315 [Planctomycetaceae bacterium]|nr:hypothetical protein [Planctomycetaceae bacterium]